MTKLPTAKVTEPHISPSSISDSNHSISSLDAEVVVKVNPPYRWKSYIWDTFDKSPEERAFLGKLDAALLSFASLGKYIFSLLSMQPK